MYTVGFKVGMNFITTLILSNFVHLSKLSLRTSLNPIKNTEKERGSQVPDTKSKYDNNVKATFLMGKQEKRQENRDGRNKRAAREKEETARKGKKKKKRREKEQENKSKNYILE